MYMNDTNWCEGTKSPCKQYFGKDIQKCLAQAEEDWNRKCPYAGGRFAESEYTAIHLTCCEDGCDILGWQYAGWNGLCVRRKERV